MRSGKVATILGLILLFTACGGSSDNPPEPLSLSIIHLNDLHSHLEPLANEVLCFDGIPTRTDLGGAVRTKGAIDALRADNANTIILEAGDAVGGTLYYTAFDGEADFAILNAYGIDAMALGNHEFDHGPDSLSDYLAWADFPILAANLDVSREPSLAGRIPAYTLKTFGHEQVAVIGVTTPESASISSPGDTIVFGSVAASVAQTVGLLQGQGINKIIVLSHIGYEADLELAESVAGIDVIVGGHSHTLLGPQEQFDGFGITVPAGYDYPTRVQSPEGKQVLVVQAWGWGRAIGELNVDFDRNGDIAAFSGRPYLVNSTEFKQDNGAGWTAVTPEMQEIILALISESDLLERFHEDPGTAAILEPFTAMIAEKRQAVVGTAADDILRGDPATHFNSGPGPLVADSMVAKTAAQGVTIAIQPRGGVKVDLLAGDITMGDVLSLLPYNSLLYTLEMTGADIRNALEDGIDYQIVNNPRSESNCPWYPYVSGLRFEIEESAAKGARVTHLEYRPTLGGAYEAFDANDAYKIVVTAYLAGGGDGYTTLRDIPAARKQDTGFIDADVFSEYLDSLGSVSNPTEERIRVNY
ncbi:MAG: 5'-nucleotidase C-terminal domain-containing protein [Desulfobacterales bacterium]|nr:5'-nucleotidase C-terminal domain-containing protein [Desulfobacterales bacterium]